uniref:Cystatin domain-containing protein n=1 Tax=Ursus maritimus TaxID=29073 RepID=A0A452TBC0_URSMA
CSCPLCRWALRWAMLLLLLGSQLLATHSWHSHDVSDCDEGEVIIHFFPATVEYTLHTFNLQSKDTKAYRLVSILNSWKEQVDNLAFTMELELRRTECGKLDKDIDNRPFQESPELNNVRHTADPSATHCFFTIGTVPWRTVFHLLYKTCLEGFH